MSYKSQLEQFDVPERLLAEAREKLKVFCDHHAQLKSKIALVTSGGTTIPIEKNTVRFIDNFSFGTRGSASAEYFLRKGYAVIFLTRKGSLQPYSRHFRNEEMLDHLTLTPEGKIEVEAKGQPKLTCLLREYKEYKEKMMFLVLDFTSLAEYLHLLCLTSEFLADFGPRALIYLAAAVSDFFIPSHKMPQHKVQSSDGPLQISLELVPKLLAPLVQDVVPKAYTVSFKLETDPAILVDKSRAALVKYKHQLVIGNILDSRKSRVVLISRNSTGKYSEESILVSAGEEKNEEVEIEKLIVDRLACLHSEFIIQSC